MKKVISFVLAAVLCLGMSTTVLAAPSPSIDSPVVDNTQTEVVMPDGSKPVEGVFEVIKEENLTSAQNSALADIFAVMNGTDEAAYNAMEKKLIKDHANLDAANVVSSIIFDLEAEVDPINGTWVKLVNMPFVAGKQSVVVLHMDDNGNWENIRAYVAADGYIYGKFTSLSPVYCFVVEKESVTPPAAINSPSVDNSYWYDGGASNTSYSTEFTAPDGTAMRYLTSAENGTISISGSQSVIPEGAEFSAKLVSDDVYAAVASAVARAKGDVSFVAYDFNLYNAAGTPITKFSRHVDVTMPIPTALDVPEGNTVTVYYYNNGKLEKCNTVVDDGFVTFGTTHFSTYVYVSETYASAASSSVVSPKTADNSMALYTVMLAIAALGGMVYTTRKAR